MPKLITIIKACDLFGETIQLNLKGHHNIKTVYGGMITILIFILLAGATWLMGNDMFYKEQPTTAIQEISYKQRPFFNLNRNNFPIAFCLQRYDQTVWDIKQYFKMEVLDWKAFNTNTTSAVKTYEFENCTNEHFPKLDDEYLTIAGVRNYYCLKDQNITIGGYWDNPYVEYAVFRIKMCQNDTKTTCAPVDEINHFFNDKLIAFNLYVQNTIIDPRNLQNPEQVYLLNLYKNVKPNSRKNFNIFIRQQELYSDEGFIFEAVSNYSSLAYDTSEVDDSDASPDSLMDINLFVAPHKMNYYRNYLKVQTVLANFGGISDALFIIVHVITFYFAQGELNQKLMNKIYDFNFEGNNQKRKIEKKISDELEKLHKVIEKERRKSQLLEMGAQVIQDEIDRSEEIMKAKKDSVFMDNRTINTPFEIELRKLGRGETIEFKVKETTQQFDNSAIKLSSEKKSRFSLEQIIDAAKKKNPEKKIKLSFCEKLNKPCCQNLTSATTRIKYALFEKASEELSKYMDITKIVQQYEEFQKLKVILLNNEQLAMFQFISKDVCSFQDRIKFNNEIAKMKAFANDHEKLVRMLLDYKDKLDMRGTPISTLDMKLFDLLDGDIKKMI
jgi:hypothetical protein